MKAFVTGGSRGIGRAVAEALIAGGGEVAIGCRGEASVDGAHVIRGDVADDPAALVDDAAAALGGLTAFVNCAVEPIAKPILEMQADDFDRTMRVNARPFVLGAIAAARHMPEGGRIVAVSSTGTHRVRNARYAPLALAKGARFAALTPMGRMGEPADAARLIAFLCSPEAGWVTGQLIFSDGGYLLA